LLFDSVQATTRLTQRFQAVDVTPLICDEATDVVEITVADPPLAALLAIVDLHCPSLSIEIGDSLAGKTMTSTFARRRDCTVAINGEAGNSGRPDCGLGPWQGWLVQRGNCLLREQPANPRPCLSFDADNHATFLTAAATERALPSGTFNAIWGRVDLLVGGKVDEREFRNRQPRTAMAIDATGSRLFLLVVDGRQERSWGMTRPEAGELLAAFGAHDGMLCDEGGSSCMYLKVFGGIGNVPSDKLGEERPTYTHFGIHLAGNR
jgi:exopolysaccharide biosynthesis protein